MTMNSTQWSVLLPVVLTLIAIQEDEDGGFFNKVKKFCYPQWAIEAFIIANAQRSDQGPSILVHLLKCHIF